MQYRNHSLDHWHFLKTPVIFGNKYLKDPTFPVIYQTSCPAYWCRSCHLCFLVDLANKITAVVAVQSPGRQGWWCWLYGCLLTQSVKYYCPLDLKATASSWKHFSLFLGIVVLTFSAISCLECFSLPSQWGSLHELVQYSAPGSPFRDFR